MPDVFTERQRRELAGRARTLHERRVGPGNIPETDPPITPERIINEWREQFSNEEAFQARLEYEDISVDEVREIASATHWPPDEPLPNWITRVEELVHYIENAPSQGEVDFSDEVPFREFFAVVAQYAREQLSEDDVPMHAVSPLLEGLVDRLETLCIRPLYVEFKSFVKHHDEELAYADPDEFTDPSKTYYRSFVDSMFKRGFRNLCLEYPVLARQLVQSVEFWIETVEETCRRIEADRSTLQDVFGVEGEVIALTTLADDTHAQGRLPIRVSFGDGDVIYKSRTVDGGIAFYTILERLEEYLSTPVNRKPRYVSRDGYGWMESVVHSDVSDDNAAHRYYQRAGVTLCLAYALNFSDCQVENVISCGEHPMIVDGETIFHPHVNADGRKGSDEIASFVDRTPFLTGLLPFVSGEADESVLDPSTASGFGTDSAERELSGMTVPSIEAANTDVMTVVEESPTVESDTNVPTVEGEDCPPMDYIDSMVEGFEETYETIHRLHANGEFFTSVADPNLMGEVENRFLYRNTALYTSILMSGTTRRALQDGVRLSVEFEELAVPFFEEQIDVDRWWSLYGAERTALRRRDIPRFTSRPDEQTVYHDGNALDIEVDLSGIERVRTRLNRMSAIDQSRQVSLLRRTFDPDESKEVDTLIEPPEPVVVTDERLRREAIELFDIALEASIETPDGEGWVSPMASVPVRLVPAEAPLYHGTSGIALAGTALYEVTGLDRYQQIAVDLLDDIVEAMATSGIDHGLGGLKGIGSVVYTLSVVSSLLDNETYQSAALDATRLVTADRLADDDTFDIMNGTAGALSGLLAYYERYGDGDVLDRAVNCGERLLDARVSADGYEVWETVEGHGPVPGFAHGQSGIAYSLARLAETTGEPRFESAAREALAFEIDKSSTIGDVDSHGPIPTRVPDWCRGLPGRTLAQFRIGTYLGDETVLAKARENLATIESADLALIDNLCCGNLGRADVLLEGTRHLDDDFVTATELIGRCLARRQRDGVFELPGHSQAFPNVSFFHGISGAVYTLLRHQNPDTFPCVLLLE